MIEGPESVGVEVAGARKSLLRKIVVVKELVDGGLKGIIVVVNIMLEVLEEKAERVGEVLVHLIQTTIHGPMNVQVVAKGTIYNPRIGDQWKTHLERVL